MIYEHIHHAAIHDDFGITYINTGNWVESCTAVVETLEGKFETIRWTEPKFKPSHSPARQPSRKAA